MRRIDDTFARLQNGGKKALVIYLTAGDPGVETSVAAAQAAVEAGADILEIGIPFSDPVADGPVIQRAMLRALDHGGGLNQALQVIRAIRATTQVPMVAFGYANPFIHNGVDRVCQALHDAGADGLLVVDVPLEESAPWRDAAKAAKLAWVPLMAPTTGLDRVQAIASSGSGFLYLVSMTAVTGGALQQVQSLKPIVAAARQASKVPLCIGFGVRDGATARQAAQQADGVVVGSAIVAQLEAGEADQSGPGRVGALVRELRAALDG